jgi:hypothetical protein
MKLENLPKMAPGQVAFDQLKDETVLDSDVK